MTVWTICTHDGVIGVATSLETAKACVNLTWGDGYRKIHISETRRSCLISIRNVEKDDYLTTVRIVPIEVSEESEQL